MLTLTQYGSFTYRGGLQLANILAGVLVVVASHPAVRALDVFASPAMRWIGKRSYAIYLWHWPIFQLTRPYQDVPFGGWGLNALRLGAVVLAADVSYRLVEQPWRTGAAPAAIRKWWASNRVWVFGTTGVAVAGVTCLVVVLVMAPESSVPPALAAGSTPAARSTITPATTDPASDRRVVQTTEPSTTAGRALVAQPGTHRTRPAPTVTTAPRSSVPAGHKTTDTAPATTTGLRTLVATGHKTTDTAPTTTTPPAPAPPPSGTRHRRLGDLDAASELQARFGPATVIDASVGRQVAAGIQRLGEYRTAGRLRTLTDLVIGLGTNGPMDPTQCQQILSMAAGIPRVIMVNVRMPPPVGTRDQQHVDVVHRRSGPRDPRQLVHRIGGARDPRAGRDTRHHRRSRQPRPARRQASAWRRRVESCHGVTSAERRSNVLAATEADLSARMPLRRLGRDTRRDGMEVCGPHHAGLT